LPIMRNKEKPFKKRMKIIYDIGLRKA